jgi:L-Ala-D/L-Glu epimerase
MKLEYKVYELQFRHAFGVSANTRTSTKSVLVRLTAAEHCAYGEACLPPYLDDTPEDTVSYLDRAISVLLSAADRSFHEVLQLTKEISSPGNAGKAAVNMALHDLFAQKENKPLAGFLGLDFPPPVNTCYTIGIGPEAQLPQKIAQASDFHILKIKAGTTDDRKLIRAIRRQTYKPLVVDVNQGWRNKNAALDMIAWMKDHGVILIEQPLPKTMHDEMKWLVDKSPLPLVADESLKDENDFALVKECFSGINIKLMKCGGLDEALRLCGLARQHGMKVMLGCMAESSCAVTAMAHLSAAADFVDLDAPLLYTNDPFSGVKYLNGQVWLDKLPGTGVALTLPLFDQR